MFLSFQMWNHPNIVSDNLNNGNPLGAQILTNTNQSISIVVRNDDSGTSEIFTSALGLFDPPCYSGNESTITTCQLWQDNSFGYQVAKPTLFNNVIKIPGSSTPLWCGIATDEMYTITIQGCNTTTPSNITLSVINARKLPDTITFLCNAPAIKVQAAFGRAGSRGATSLTNPISPDPYLKLSGGFIPDNGVLPPTYSTFVSAIPISGDSGIGTGTIYTIGLWDPAMIGNNWWEPTVLSTEVGVTVTILTFQEGGLPNTVNVGMKLPLEKITSVFILSTFTGNFSLSWFDHGRQLIVKTEEINVIAGLTLSNVLIKDRMNVLVTNAVSTITGPITHSVVGLSTWYEYQVTFSSTYTFEYVQRASFFSSDKLNVRVTTLQTLAYPTYFSSPSGIESSGRLTTHK